MGGGDHGHHEHHFPKIPDWKCYKWEDFPELAQLQKISAQKGLRDPWLRNEVWRFDPKEFGPYKNYPKFSATMFKGFKWGLGDAIICTLYTKMTDDHHHDASHGGHGGHH